jgi:hypothetical protein
MKYEKLNEPVFVNKITHLQGRNSEDILEIHLTGIRTKTEYKTWLDPKFANYGNWDQIIEAAEDKGVVLSNLKFKDILKNLVNADSKPKIEYIVTREELALELSDYWSALSEYTTKFGPL